MEDYRELMDRMLDLDKDKLEYLAELGYYLKNMPGIHDPNSREYYDYPEEFRECYLQLREDVPEEFTNHFILAWACGEYGDWKLKDSALDE